MSTPTEAAAKAKQLGPARGKSKVHLANLAKLKREHAEREKERDHISHLQDLAMNRNAREVKDQLEEKKRQQAMQQLIALEEKRAHR